MCVLDPRAMRSIESVRCIIPDRGARKKGNFLIAPKQSRSDQEKLRLHIVWDDNKLSHSTHYFSLPLILRKLCSQRWCFFCGAHSKPWRAKRPIASTQQAKIYALFHIFDVYGCSSVRSLSADAALWSTITIPITVTCTSSWLIWISKIHWEILENKKFVPQLAVFGYLWD